MKNKGFTLIELVTVIVLLGILAAVAVPRYTNIQDSARSAQRKQIRNQIQSAINMTIAANLAAGESLADAIPTKGEVSPEQILSETPSTLTYASDTGTYTIDGSTIIYTATPTWYTLTNF